MSKIYEYVLCGEIALAIFVKLILEPLILGI